MLELNVQIQKETKGFSLCKCLFSEYLLVLYKAPRCLESFFSLLELQIQDSKTPLSWRHSVSFPRARSWVPSIPHLSVFLDSRMFLISMTSVQIGVSPEHVSSLNTRCAWHAGFCGKKVHTWGLERSQNYLPSVPLPGPSGDYTLDVCPSLLFYLDTPMISQNSSLEVFVIYLLLIILLFILNRIKS